ncbi:hypothetical protein [Arenimonas sp. MALMAid1274]|uniref:hypothetical protein n=1 Tax=Arenimonas sp. MALMAid1274 TaxID=3411630 RepID=UPI003B9F4751
MAARQHDAGRLRRQVAQEAAKLMAEGLADVAQARRKAAARLGVRDEACLPGGDEIRAALQERQRLFQPAAADGGALRRQRQAAREAMAFFSTYSPCLVGPVLDGSAGRATPVTLHLHADESEPLVHLLSDQRIPATQRTRRVWVDRSEARDCPAWEFEADGVGFELVLLPAASRRQGPWDPMDDRPLPRANAAGVAALLEGGSATPVA